MKELLSKSILIFLLLGLFLISCEKDNEINSNIDFEFLEGYWIDQESFALQFIHFYSNEQARFGLYNRNFTSYDTFYYKFFENKLAIAFIGDNEEQETIHDIIVRDDFTIEISDLTDIPENPNKVYKKQNINTFVLNDTIELKFNEIIYNFDNDFRLQLDSVITDSRCPIDADCVWEGNAEIRFDLIVEGNYQYLFDLNTNSQFQVDTLLKGLRFKLIRVLPYPKSDEVIKKEDYKVEIVINKE